MFRHARQRIIRVWQAAGKAAVDAAFPRRCAGCGREGTVWCASCAARPFIPPSPACAFCDAPGSWATCRDCRAVHALDGCVLFLPYVHPAVRGVLTGWKYQGDAAYADVLRGWVTSYGSSLGDVPPTDAVTAVPLHAARLRARGYNQADVLAETVAERAGRPVIMPLVRVKATAPQARVPRAERRAADLAGAFAAAGPVPAHVLLVDDVKTTGATLDAAAQALKAAGAETVWACTVAG